MEGTRADNLRGNTNDLPNGKKSLEIWVDTVKSDLQMLGVINNKDLTNSKEAWRDVVVEAKGLYQLMLGHKRKKKKNVKKTQRFIESFTSIYVLTQRK